MSFQSVRTVQILLKKMSDTQKRIDELRQQIDEKRAELKPLENELSSIYRDQEEQIRILINQANAGKYRFQDTDLVYSATTRCRCGEGLAYPKGIGPNGSWFCAGILTGRALDVPNFKEVEHDSGYPFTFYSIISETQPRANGHTTRPK
jgi:hypothetical protein